MAKHTYITEISWLIEDWDWEKNNAIGIFPDKITTGSDKYAFWKCHDCGEEEYRRCNNRFYGHGCKKCANLRGAEKRTKAIIEKNGSFGEIFPELAKEWHPTNNENITPYDVSVGSDIMAWWMCDLGHAYEAKIYKRVKGEGCPYCAGKRVFWGFNDLQTLYPKLASEWHPTRNCEKTPRNVLSKSNRMYWWLCPLGHDYEARISNRANGTGCPYCAGKKVLVGFNDLKSQAPEVALDWHPANNGLLTPEQVTVGSKKDVDWKCHVCGYTWRQKVYVRKKSGCPACANRVLYRGVNDLQTLHPEIAAEWHPTKNESLTPSDVVAGGNVKRYWQCKMCGHSWDATIFQRISGCGCPQCAKIKRAKTRSESIVKTSGSLRQTHPELIKEWNFVRNKDIIPDDVSHGSTLEVWWICSSGHEWKAEINSRTNGNGCPKCSDEFHSSFPEQIIYFYLSKVTTALNRERILGKEIDIFLPNINVGVEYDGKYYHTGRKVQDKAKTEFFKRAGIRIIRVVESNMFEIKDDDIYIVKPRKYGEKRYDSLKDAVCSLCDILNLQIPNIDISRDSSKIYGQYIYQKKLNSLAVKFPEIASEWDYEKNYPITPEMVSYGTDKNVYWKCQNGHSWKSAVSSRTGQGGHGCGICAGKRLSEKIKDERDKIVISFIKNDPKVSVSKISSASGLTVKQIYSTIAKMKKDGSIMRDGNNMTGQWILK